MSETRTAAAAILQMLGIPFEDVISYQISAEVGGSVNVRVQRRAEQWTNIGDIEVRGRRTQIKRRVVEEEYVIV